MGWGSFSGHSSAQCLSCSRAGTRSCSELSPISSADVSTWWSSSVSRVLWGWHGCPRWPGGWEWGTGAICPAAVFFSTHFSHLFQPQGNSSCTDGLVLESSHTEGEEWAESREPGGPWFRVPLALCRGDSMGHGPGRVPPDPSSRGPSGGQTP